MTFEGWYYNWMENEDNQGLSAEDIANAAWRAATKEWEEVFGHISKDPDECGNLINERIKDT